MGQRERPRLPASMWQLKSPDGPFRLCPADQIASLLRNMCQGYEEDRRVHFPGLVLMQRFARRFLARRKQEIAVAELDSLKEQAAIRIQRTVRCYLSRACLGHCPPASSAAPLVSDLLDTASPQADTAPPKPATQWLSTGLRRFSLRLMTQLRLPPRLT